MFEFTNNNFDDSFLYEKFKPKFKEDKFLSRQLVSFQANKNRPKHRWFKYKEGFSANLVEYYINKFNIRGGKVLDPFAGIGTSLFVASENGCDATGIEILPVGVFVIEARKILEETTADFLREIKKSLWENVNIISNYKFHIEHIPITRFAFPEETEKLLNKYLEYAETKDKKTQVILKFIAISVLEEVSYTRKDGQYLRWDYRSKRNTRQKFFKGEIKDFKTAINEKFNEIIFDLEAKNDSLFPQKQSFGKGNINVIEGSCLFTLPELDERSYDLIITSPPYANRYDYTRTYALELVFLGRNDDEVKKLRQELLSCTVENKSKVELIKKYYENKKRLKDFDKIIETVGSNIVLSAILEQLKRYKKEGKLNNNGILTLVENYFLEMAFTIFEMSRILNSGGKIVMVNDNVRYAGISIPVDLILSEMAEEFGLNVEGIYVLPQKKGNSSQQMGKLGKTPLRKCVYIWEKTNEE